MFYEGYNIDSEASAANIKVGKKIIQKNTFISVAVFNFTWELYVDGLKYEYLYYNNTRR